MYTVLITDERCSSYDRNSEFFAEMDAWAKAHCKSYLGYSVQDVSDLSYQWDEIAEFTFVEQHDAMWFRLKYE